MEEMIGGKGNIKEDPKKGKHMATLKKLRLLVSLGVIGKGKNGIKLGNEVNGPSVHNKEFRLSFRGSRGAVDEF